MPMGMPRTIVNSVAISMIASVVIISDQRPNVPTSTSRPDSVKAGQIRRPLACHTSSATSSTTSHQGMAASPRSTRTSRSSTVSVMPRNTSP
jgi:hypothetical protein